MPLQTHQIIVYCDLQKSIGLGDESPSNKETMNGISTKSMDESDWEIFTTQLDQDLAQISVPAKIVMTYTA